jgi:hypothetical protein
MFTLELTKEEKDLWLDMLEYDYKELRNEISNTENWVFKEGLKKREQLLKKILGALQ